jgi:V/A-type H+-transporting ATPase subunit D
MELTRLKGRLKTAVRGHKLLKDKRDELVRQFMLIAQRTRELRTKIDAGITEANGHFSIASGVMSPEAMDLALLYPRQHVELKATTQNIMSVNVPVYDVELTLNDPSDIYPYGYAATCGELDDALSIMAEVFSDMLELAEKEKTMFMLADEIEKTRRRVNALEHVMIPETQETIKYIAAKLAENDLSTKVRLLKVKDMVLQKAHDFKD